jgi:aspartate aminotransferase-like enzyme
MVRLGRYVFKLAESATEYEQIHRLNYLTFVQEIRQHSDTGNGSLVDKYHGKNTYFLALRDGRLVGMLSAHDLPPFSITQRLSDPRLIQKPGMKPLEVRLLAVEPEERGSPVLAGLVYSLYQYGRAHGHTHFVISGVTGQEVLYKHIGFEPLGPPVGRAGAMFVPMITTLDRVEIKMQRTMKLWERRMRRAASTPTEPISMLPGPVPVSPDVRQAFEQPPIYHRSPEFVAIFEDVRRNLEQITNAPGVALFVGSGTLANEAVAATLAADRNAECGLMLVNGEFGRRIVRQAQRFGLQPQILEWPWGQPWDLDHIAEALTDMPEDSWIWGVHQESSTGVMNDLAGLVEIARRRRMRVCADCVSSLGAVPVDLSEVYLATGATGKAFSSYAGIALVFADPVKLTNLNVDRVPGYLDLPATLASVGPRFTVPSSLMNALCVALKVYSTPERARARYDHYANLGRFVRDRLREIGLPPLADESVASPVITSFYPPGDESSFDFVNRCQEWGFLIGGQSGYLMEQRLVQIANMGTIRRSDLEDLFEHMERYMHCRGKYQAV